jgi:hypothetical protein
LWASGLSGDLTISPLKDLKREQVKHKIINITIMETWKMDELRFIWNVSLKNIKIYVVD